jgi:hypothetical protein
VSNNQKPQPSLNKIIGMEAYPPKTRSLGTHLAINRPPSDNFRILRRAWAGFAMEAAYWDSLHDICTVKNITHYELVAAAKDQFPNLHTRASVQLYILDYFYRFSLMPEPRPDFPYDQPMSGPTSAPFWIH